MSEKVTKRRLQRANLDKIKTVEEAKSEGWTLYLSCQIQIVIHHWGKEKFFGRWTLSILILKGLTFIPLSLRQMSISFLFFWDVLGERGECKLTHSEGTEDEYMNNRCLYAFRPVET